MRLTVTTKIFLGLAVIVMTFGLVSIYALVQVHHIGRSLELTSRTYLPLTKLASQLETIQSHRSRDNNRLLEEREARVQGALITIARRHHPKLVREQISLGMGIARAGRERATEPAESEFLAAIERRLAALEETYVTYDANADALYRLLEARGGQPGSSALLEEVDEAASDLRRIERRIEREIKDLGADLEGKVTERVRRADAEESRVTFTILLLSLTAVLIAFAVILFVQRTLRPIQRLTEVVKHVSRGNYAQRIEAHGRDEIAGLAREFNHMAQALTDREAELVSQRTALLRAERLAAVGHMAAQISHEIRNPLSSIGLNAELIGDELPRARFEDPAVQREVAALLQAISAEIDRLTEITEQYLGLTRMPRPTLDPEDLNVIVRDVSAFVHGEMSAAGIDMVLDLEPNLPLASVDESQLRQALLNLLRNAREALAGKKGTVTVKTSCEANRLMISVSDDGPGIPEEYRDSIFDPFVSTKRGGTGLGLPLTQQILTEHGGSLTFDTEAEQLTTFRMELQIATETDSADPSPLEHQPNQGAASRSPDDEHSSPRGRTVG